MVRRRKRDRKWHAICCLFAADILEPDRGTDHEATRVDCVCRRWRDRRWSLAHHRNRHPRAAAAAGTSRTAHPSGATDRAGRSEAADRAGAGGQEGTSSAGDAGNYPVGLVQQRPAASVAHQFRRHRRHGNDDAQPQSGHSRHHDRADQEAQNRFSRPRTAHVDRTDLYRGRRAG